MNLKTGYHSVTYEEAKILSSNGCSCSDWERVSVMDGFDPSTFRVSDERSNQTELHPETKKDQYLPH